MPSGSLPPVLWTQNLGFASMAQGESPPRAVDNFFPAVRGGGESQLCMSLKQNPGFASAGGEGGVSPPSCGQKKPWFCVREGGGVSAPPVAETKPWF